jgi:tetratricopeptide (TPR) repeat protein
MNIVDRPYFIARLVSWHKEDRHSRIVEAIEKLGEEHWDYDIASLYSRALNNLGSYQKALDILLDFKEEGRNDSVWYFRIGYSLYHLGRAAEAAEFFIKAIEYGDEQQDTRRMLQASLEEARRRQEGGEKLEIYSAEELEALEAHIEKYFGPYRNVYHEVASLDIHVDIAIVEPSRQRNYYALITMGMGARKMNVPGASKDQDRAELIICLPPDWDLDKLEDERWYWPLRWLKILARLPITDNTWLGWGHTIPNGEPFADNTKFCALLLLNPGAFGKKSAYCKLPNGERVNFYQVVPLYEEETQFKEKNNVQILLNFLDRDALEYVRIDRENICEDVITF